jgi:serine/threonine protein kinase
VRRKERRMSCAASRQFTRENGDYLVTANEVIHSPRCSYQVLDVLGRGTFGQVLKAWRADTSQLVALKVLKNIPSYTKQGQLEIDVLTRLSCQAAHEFNIVQVTPVHLFIRIVGDYFSMKFAGLRVVFPLWPHLYII